jgi:hypothetical protein
LIPDSSRDHHTTQRIKQIPEGILWCDVVFSLSGKTFPPSSYKKKDILGIFWISSKFELSNIFK